MFLLFSKYIFIIPDGEFLAIFTLDLVLFVKTGHVRFISTKFELCAMIHAHTIIPFHSFVMCCKMCEYWNWSGCDEEQISETGKVFAS